jgi:glycine/D-amino acid oxidase-like deaminating enzyme
MPARYRELSYWLETSGDDLTPRPALPESIDVDVAILGAGFSGLWTAWYLKEREPSLEIAIVEREIAGFGASGRNGAWCTSEFPTGPGALAKSYPDAKHGRRDQAGDGWSANRVRLGGRRPVDRRSRPASATGDRG